MGDICEGCGGRELEHTIIGDEELACLLAQEEDGDTRHHVQELVGAYGIQSSEAIIQRDGNNNDGGC